VRQRRDLGLPSREGNTEPDFLIVRDGLQKKIPRHVDACHEGAEDEQRVHPRRPTVQNLA
jgi:hypothetical protein